MPQRGAERPQRRARTSSSSTATNSSLPSPACAARATQIHRVWFSLSCVRSVRVERVWRSQEEAAQEAVVKGLVRWRRGHVWVQARGFRESF
eukprot:3404796-Rhodomonas_salina.2